MFKVKLNPVEHYSRDRYPILWKLTQSPTTTFEGWNIKISDNAADYVEKYPDALFHNRVYNAGINGTYSYWKGEENICVVDSRCLCCSEEVLVMTPDEYGGEGEQTVKLADNYPAMFLPFELDQLCYMKELELSRKGSGYSSDEFPKAIYLRSSPLVAYQVFHYLVNYTGVLNGKEINKAIEIGSGLAAVSFLASQLLREVGEICGVELDDKLVMASSQIKNQLKKRLSVNFPNVRLRKKDIFEMSKEISESNLLIGWFPLGYNISDSRMMAMFRDLSSGGIVIEIFRTGPLSNTMNVEKQGFERVQFKDPIPAGIFIRQ